MSRSDNVASTVRKFTSASLHDSLFQVIKFYGCTVDDALKALSPDEGKAHRRRWQRDHHRARRVVMNHFTLLPGMVVHHQDENPSNSAVNNLRVFASNADHIAYHHGKPVKPIWYGDSKQVSGYVMLTWTNGAPIPCRCIGHCVCPQLSSHVVDIVSPRLAATWQAIG